MSEHFFRRRSTYVAQGALSEPSHWSIYVGLGATIDRIDLTWEGLVAQLLDSFSKHTDARPEDVREWIRLLGAQRAATSVETLLKANGGDWVSDLQTRLRGALYGPRRLLAGSLVDALAEWASAIALAGGSVVFLTPNYDEYLYKALQDIRLELGASDYTLNKLVVLNSRGPLLLPRNLREPGVVTCIHLHGYVPDSGRAQGLPVLGELGYNATAARTTRAIIRAANDSNLLLVGSSIHDSPLVDALLSEDLTTRRRLAILPYQGAEWRNGKDGPSAGIHELSRQRLSALKVEMIVPDYYGQVSQLMYEAADTVGRGDANKILRSRYKRRYDERLGKWWTDWSKIIEDPKAQAHGHELLESVFLPKIRRALGAHANEGLKLEIWARYSPNHDRELALWATSLGTWKDPHLMRRDTLDLESKHMAIGVFCAGSPKFHFEQGDSTSRWRAFFGVPIWRYSKSGRLPVGVATIASTWSPAPPNPHRRSGQDIIHGCIRENNLTNIKLARVYLDLAGGIILTRKSRKRDYDSEFDAIRVLLAD